MPNSDAIDIRFSDHGSVWLMTPCSPAGRAWIAEHVQTETSLGDGFGVEPRCAEAIADGASADGLTVELS